MATTLRGDRPGFVVEEFRIPDLREARYLDSPKLVIEDDVFYCAPLPKALLEEMDRANDVVSKESGLDPLNWPEAPALAGESSRHLECGDKGPPALCSGSSDGRAARDKMNRR